MLKAIFCFISWLLAEAMKYANILDSSSFLCFTFLLLAEAMKVCAGGYMKQPYR